MHRFFPNWTFPSSPIWIRFLFKIRTRDEIRFAFVTTFPSRAPPRVCVIIPLRQKDESRGSGSGKHGDPRQQLYRWRKRCRQILCITIDLEKERVLRVISEPDVVGAYYSIVLYELFHQFPFRLRYVALLGSPPDRPPRNRCNTARYGRLLE